MGGRDPSERVVAIVGMRSLSAPMPSLSLSTQKPSVLSYDKKRGPPVTWGRCPAGRGPRHRGILRGVSSRGREIISKATWTGRIATAEKMSLEGIVSKRRDSRYKSGRTDRWRKVKCRTKGEFVVLGTAIEKKSGAHRAPRRGRA